MLRTTGPEVAPACGWGSARFAPKAGDLGSDAAKAVPIPVQASPFVMERVALGARQAAEVSSSTGSMPHALVTAVKMALSELFMSAYDAEPLDLEAIKRTGMSHLLQFLFDLRFLRIALAAGPAPGPELMDWARRSKRGGRQQTARRATMC
ncbi:unnamed protein product [Prorocentrum cordatum]|uniref:Uncharacterized protein n=1 Tax=Prorocentrum cordatum TaxID=2364126 RepID=A0ABN9VX46_9DINO|nr:unnamed protein product [Polarella glacialis]